MANSLTYFPVSGDYRNVADPSISGTTDLPQVQIIEALVTFFPRLPVGFTALVTDFILEAATNEVQTVTVNNSPTGGTFTLSLDGDVTAGIAYNAVASDVQTALAALPNVGAGNVSVVGSDGTAASTGPFTVTFQGTLAGAQVSVLVPDWSGLTVATPTVAVTTTTPGAPGINEVQTVTLPGAPTGGSFTLTFAGQTTGAIAYNATAAQVQAALQALSSIGLNNVSVAGSAGGPYTVTFTGALGSQNVGQMVGTSSLAGPSPQVALVMTTQGAAARNEQQSITLNGPPTGGTFTLSFGGQTTIALAYNAAASDVQTALQALSSIGSGNAVVTGSARGPYTVTFQGTLASQDVAMMTSNASSLTGGSITILEAVKGTSPVNEVQTATLSGSITGGSFTLSFNGHTTAPILYNASAAVVQSALEALPSIGAGNVAVTGAAGGPYTIAFQANLGNNYEPLMTSNPSGLTGTNSIAVTTNNDGVPPANEVQAVTVTAAGGGTFTLTYSGQTTTALAWNASASDVQIALSRLANIGAGNVTVAGPPGGPYSVTFVGTLTGTNLPQMTATGSLTPPGATVTVQEPTRGTAQVARDTAIALPPRYGRVWNGQLSTIDIDDTPGVELVANTAILGLAGQNIPNLIYDVQFSKVTYAGGSQTIKNFAFTAPTDATPVVLTDPNLARLDYLGP